MLAYSFWVGCFALCELGCQAQIDFTGLDAGAVSGGVPSIGGANALGDSQAAGGAIATGGVSLSGGATTLATPVGGPNGGFSGYDGEATAGGTSSAKWDMTTWAINGGAFPSGGGSVGGPDSTGGTGIAGTEVADASDTDGGHICSCDNVALRDALTYVATPDPSSCWCELSSDSSEINAPWGTFSIDSEGLVSAATGPVSGSVNTLASLGWCCPAEAGRTYSFWCGCHL
jgi:hypothetical protein